MTAHSISILSELKMSSSGPYEDVLSIKRYQVHSVEGRAVCPAVPQCHELVTGKLATGQGSK